MQVDSYSLPYWLFVIISQKGEKRCLVVPVTVVAMQLQFEVP